MTGEMGVEDGIAPIVIIERRRRVCDVPASQCGAGLGLRAIAQKKSGNAAFSNRQGEPAAGHQVQAFGHAFHFQEQGAHMR